MLIHVNEHKWYQQYIPSFFFTNKNGNRSKNMSENIIVISRRVYQGISNHPFGRHSHLIHYHNNISMKNFLIRWHNGSALILITSREISLILFDFWSKLRKDHPKQFHTPNTLFASSFDFLFEIVPNWDSLMSDVVGGRKGGTSEMDGKHSVS